ncbi:MAG TPA: 6-phosphogluconolactonase [Haliangiales bacterium]|nr:6-phosphogluconolactonase [Haliangiales bacterium]
MTILVADDVARAGAEWIAARRPRTVALAGGTTPRAIYLALAAAPLPWAEMHVYFGDERAVPPDDPESNYRMARETLLARAPIPPENVHRMEAERADLEAAAEEYGRRLPDALDLVILGMGEDGHTASLFPGRPAGAGKVMVVRDAPKPPPVRLSLTPRAIRGAAARLVVVTGAGKAAMVRAALRGPEDPGRIPVQVARHGVWLLDRAAAGLLEENDAG